MTWPTSKYNFDKRVAHESRDVSTRKTNNPCKSWNVKLREVEPRHEKPQRFAYAKTKTQISFAVTAKLISAFVFEYIDCTIPLLAKSKISSL